MPIRNRTIRRPLHRRKDPTEKVANENPSNSTHQLGSFGALEQQSLVPAWMIRYPRQLPIVGPRKVEDLDESLSASEVTLTAEQVDFLTADP
jgi:aryl-alcohol dehydrogenase-like predicted oxidoreductase